MIYVRNPGKGMWNLFFCGTDWEWDMEFVFLGHGLGTCVSVRVKGLRYIICVICRKEEVGFVRLWVTLLQNNNRHLGC